MIENNITIAPSERIMLPCIPSHVNERCFEHQVYIGFMKYLRQTSDRCSESCILSAILAVSASLNISSALTAKMLCDLGLRAPRHAYPTSFLDFADNKTLSNIAQSPSPSVCVRALHEYWGHIRDHKLAFRIKK